MLTRKRMILTLLLLAVAGAWLAMALTSAQANARQPAAVQQYGMTWDVVASGGTTMSSSSYRLESTTGQAVAGPSSNEDHTLLSGYWQEFLWRVLLPIVLR